MHFSDNFLLLMVAPCLRKMLTIGEVGQMAYRKPLYHFCNFFVRLKLFQNKMVLILFFVCFLFYFKRRRRWGGSSVTGMEKIRRDQ